MITAQGKSLFSGKASFHPWNNPGIHYFTHLVEMFQPNLQLTSDFLQPIAILQLVYSWGLFCVWLSCLHKCLYNPHVLDDLVFRRRRQRIPPGPRVRNIYTSPYRYWEQKPGPLQEQQVLLTTESSLQTLVNWGGGVGKVFALSWRVTSHCEPSDMGAGNQTQVLW